MESKFDLVAALLKAGEAWETGGRHTEPHLSSKISSSVNFSKMWAACTLPPVQSSNPSFSLESRSFLVFMCWHLLDFENDLPFAFYFAFCTIQALIIDNVSKSGSTLKIKKKVLLQKYSLFKSEISLQIFQDLHIFHISGNPFKCKLFWE